MLQKIKINDIKLKNGKLLPEVLLTYEVFGQSLGLAPIVLVNHALTGNSSVCGEKGWWKNLIDYNQIIDLNHYTVIAFNIPGNHYIENNGPEIDYKELTAKDIAHFFWSALEKLDVNKLYAVIGGSLGGGITWEMGYLFPKRINHLIPVATHYFSTDWVIGNVLIQDEILNQPINPIETARKHAMFLYRTPNSINERFANGKENDLYLVEDWLNFHGKQLKSRFVLEAYKQMNYLLKTIDVPNIDYLLNNFKGKIHVVCINSDLLFFVPHIIYENLERKYSNIQLKIIDSIHGHDAFLMEYEKINLLLKPIFKNKTN